MTVTERLVVVTGTSGGLGRSIARGLIEHNYNVVGVARRSVDPDELATSSDRYQHIRFDIGRISELKQLADEIIREHGKPYALVNNAAIAKDGLLPTMHNSEIEDLIRVNLTASIVLTKYLVRPMLSARRGRIVNISSIVAKTGYRGLAAYGATKAALEGFTRSLARDLGQRGVTVNAVAPGFLDTEMTASMGAANLERIRNRSALGRFASTVEVAGAVTYLLSEVANAVTGTTVTVDGGSTA